jgi:hypothetical protein
LRKTEEAETDAYDAIRLDPENVHALLALSHLHGTANGLMNQFAFWRWHIERAQVLSCVDVLLGRYCNLCANRSIEIAVMVGE